MTNITISSEVVSLFSNIAKNSTNAVIQDDSPKWVIDEQIDQTIVKLRDLLLENGFDYSLSIGQAMDIISSLPNNKKEPLLFFLSTCYELNEYIQGTQTKSFWEDWIMEISMAAPGAIWGTAIGVAIGGPAGAAIGQVAGLLIGSAMGAVISNYGNTSVISGRIADIDGIGIPGVCIETTGSNNGTVTGIDGGFTLRVPCNAKIVVSCIGYKTEVIDTSNKGVLLVTLKEDSF